MKEYYDNGYSLLPLKKNSKIPCIYWKQYKDKRANFDDVLGWYKKFDNPNIGIITGGISSLTVIDVDDTSILPELIKQVPEITGTTRVKTRRGYHYYFSGNGVNSTNNLLNMGVELKSGGYVVAPPSIIDDVTYTFEIPLSEIIPLPIYLIEKEGYKAPDKAPEKVGYKAPDVEYKNRRILGLPYHGKKVDCIRQILSRDLQVGERDNSLYILYNLLLQNDNKKDYSKKIVTEKNRLLTKPLPGKEVEIIFKKAYNHKCSSIIEKLPFIKCDKCKLKFKGGELKMGNILIRNLRKLPELSNTETRVVCLLGTYYEGENPTNYEIAKKTGMNKNTVSNAMERLKKKGFF
ncbi:MAG: bifunctional DNA primase/polymerase [Actinobacteria bacterium]|nr:bifunctional DNA primase/polymerase [Actinomycetota bacterium]